MVYEGFVDLGYKPSGKDLSVLFYIEPPEGKTVEWSAVRVAGESSVGTWTDVSTSVPRIKESLTPRIYGVDEKTGVVKIAYPQELFEYDNMPEILSSIAGNVYGMKDVQNLRLIDATFPKGIVRSYAGPAHGIEGIRKILGVKDRPLVGTIVKPKLGLNTREHAACAYESWAGGCDIVKDDENLSSQKFNPFKDRVTQTLAMCDKAESETGEKKVYMPNVTAETMEMLERIDYVKSQGGTYIMADVITVGFSALQTVRKNSRNLVIHAHRAMHAALTRNKKHGITMLALAKIYRLIGVDQLHIGTVVGKMEGGQKEVVGIRDSITEKTFNGDASRMPQDWCGLKSVFPVCSGGLHQGHIPELMKILGNDIIMQAGGGVHGHPDGSRAGATAMRQAVSAVLEGKTLPEYAKNHSELSRALEKFARK